MLSACHTIGAQSVLVCFPRFDNSVFSNTINCMGFPGGSVVKNPTANARYLGLIPGLRRSHGEGNGNTLQYSCLGNSMNRGAWRTTVGVVTKVSDLT